MIPTCVPHYRAFTDCSGTFLLCCPHQNKKEDWVIWLRLIRKQQIDKTPTSSKIWGPYIKSPSREVLFGLALRKMNSTRVVLCVYVLNPALKAEGAALPLLHVLQPSPSQETKVMTWYRLNNAGVTAAEDRGGVCLGQTLVSSQLQRQKVITTYLSEWM